MCIRDRSNFAPLGATWHHSGFYGVYKSFVSKDTVFKGQACRKIEQDIYVNLGKFYPFLYTTRDLYIYDNDDTVFCYNDRIDRFTPLFVFNLNSGDTLRLP